MTDSFILGRPSVAIGKNSLHDIKENQPHVRRNLKTKVLRHLSFHGQSPEPWHLHIKISSLSLSTIYIAHSNVEVAARNSSILSSSTNMEKKRSGVLTNVASLFTLLFLFMTFPTHEAETLRPREVNDEQSTLKTYIVHVKNPGRRVSDQMEDLDSLYRSLMPVSRNFMKNESHIVYTYRNVITGFAARLTAEEAKAMEENKWVLFVRPDMSLSLHTTHSPNFLGLHQGVGFWKQSNLGKGVIIGVLDSGISSDHPSFSDKGVPPPPAKWKGKCEYEGVTCNNKLIGARTFQNSRGHSVVVDSMPPQYEEGHGTHVSSIAAGNFVNGANVLGNAKGTAAGVAPLAHLAIYKVCSVEGCAESDILAAFDAALEDGVDVISVSLGDQPVESFLSDIIAIGAFSAIQRGIFVSSSAGNIGPFNHTVQNTAPWVLTVGASTTDRLIKATARLGMGEEYDGESLFQPTNFKPTILRPLVYAGAIASSPFCSPGTLTKAHLKGEVVLCEGGGEFEGISRGEQVKEAGGSAMILMNDELDGYTTLAEEHVLPATYVSHAAGLKIKSYIDSASQPMATILFKGTVIGKSHAPMVSSFSSRGPNLASPGILKPDVIGPGVDILAAWSPFGSNSSLSSKFFMFSGTSVSCAHLSGIGALLKSSHPNWSPAAIKSAIMTTADVLNLEGRPIVDHKMAPANIFATGAGHVNPSKANDPGLVYDIKPNDYIRYLCALNYTDIAVQVITRRTVECSEVKSIPEAQLNYPALSVVLGSRRQTFTRTVTNVGLPNSSYSVKVVSPKGVSVSLSPDKLIFTKLNQKKTYSVTLSRTDSSLDAGEEFAVGYLKWVSDSGRYSVRSPIAVVFVGLGA